MKGFNTNLWFCCIAVIQIQAETKWMIMNEFQWTNETRFFIITYVSIYSQQGPLFVISKEIDGNTYTQRGDYFLSHIFFRKTAVAIVGTHLQTETPLIDCVFLARLRYSKSDHVVLITWSPSGYTPVVLSYRCLLIRAWQLVKAYGVTRNELKIHVICYITIFRDRLT